MAKTYQEVDFNKGFGQYNPPLIEAIINGHESTAMYLVNADINVQYNGMTVLDLAARKDMINLTKHVILERDVPMVFDGKHGPICHAASCDQL